MSDKQDQADEIQSMVQKFQKATTIEPNLNVLDQTRIPKMSNATSYSCSDDKKNYTGEETTIERNLPELNVPEKILFVVDTCKELDVTPFTFGTGAKYAPFQMIKKVIEMFVIAKSGFQRGHEFALMTMSVTGTHWICDFTSNVKSILNHLNLIFEDMPEYATEDQEELKTYNIGQVFERIQEHIYLPDTRDDILPTYVTRAILIYSRSNCIPKFLTGRQSFEELTDNQYFFLDSLYVHEPPNEDKQCEEIYTELNALDVRGFSFIFEVGRISRKIYEEMAKLMAHPLQRPLQRDTCYGILTNANTQEVHTNV